MTSCSESTLRRSRIPAGPCCIRCFTGLSFLSQRVEALTCPRCMAPEHSKSECALSTLEPVQEPPRVRQPDTGRQPGPPQKRFRREGTPTSQPSSQAAKVSYCFSFNKGQCFRHPKPYDREHKCIHCGKDHLTRPRSFLLPHECGGVSEHGLTIPCWLAAI